MFCDVSKDLPVLISSACEDSPTIHLKTQHRDKGLKSVAIPQPEPQLRSLSSTEYTTQITPILILQFLYPHDPFLHPGSTYSRQQCVPQYTQCTYNVTFRRLRVIIAAVEKQ